MADHETDNSNRDQRLLGEADLARAYRAAAREQPPAALDALIQAQARERLEPARHRGMRWMIPLSVAAVLVLSVSVVLQLSQRDTSVLEEMTPSRSVTDRVAPRMDAPAEAKRPAAPAPRASADVAPKPTRADPEPPPAAASSTPDEHVSQGVRAMKE